MSYQPSVRSILIALVGTTAAIRLGYGAIIPTLPVYAREMGLSAAMVAAMTNAYLLANMLLQSPAGMLSDRLGRRAVMIAGAALYTAAAALFLVPGEPWFYVMLRAFEGAGAAAFAPAARAYLADIVPAGERGRAYGHLFAAEMAGLLLGPMVGGAAQALGGSQAPFVACAALGLVAFLWLLLSGSRRPLAQVAAGEEPAPTRGTTTRQILLSAAFWAVTLPSLGFAYLNGLYSVVWAFYLEKVGATLFEINLSYTLYALPMVVLVGPFGRMADRYGRALLVGVGGVVAAAATLGYGLAPIPIALLGLCLLDGTAGAIYAPASQAFMADVTPPEIRGKFMGLVGTVSTGATILVATWLGTSYERFSALVLFGLGALAIAFSTISSVILMNRTAPKANAADS